MNITAVIFDIDGTLYRNSIALCRMPFIHFKSLLWILRYGKMRKALRVYCAENFEKNSHELSSERFWSKSVEFFSKQNSLPSCEAEYLLEKHIYNMWITTSVKIPLRIGIRKFIGDLYRSHIKLGILSDFRAKQKIIQWGIKKYFDVILSGEDEGILKPNPEIFLRCCKYMNCDPHTTAYIGNHLSYDGIGAKQAGLISVVFSSRKKYLAKTYGIIPVSSVYDIRKILFPKI